MHPLTQSEKSAHVRSMSIPEKLALALSDSFQKLKSTPPSTPVEDGHHFARAKVSLVPTCVPIMDSVAWNQPSV